MAGVGALKNLTRLTIARTAVTSLDEVASLKKLTHLGIHGTKIPPSEAAALRKERKGLRIS